MPTVSPKKAPTKKTAASLIPSEDRAALEDAKTRLETATVKKATKKAAPAATSTSNGAPKKVPAKKAAKPTLVPPAPKTRETVYEKVSVKLRAGDSALTCDDAKKLLGWTPEPEGSTFAEDYLLTDLHGKKIRCSNNGHNRPFDRGLALLWAQEILNRRWRLNGETLIIGKTGETISAQHRLAGLILATQEWEMNRDEWSHLWETPPVLESIIVFGIDEGDGTVNTIDTGRPRSLSDVLFRTSDLFASITKESERKQVCRMAGYAIKLLKYRVGAGKITTHSDSLDFVSRHPRLLNCVADVWSEDSGKDRKIGRFLSPGYFAALLYLMGCSATDPKTYAGTGAEPPNEKSLDWSKEDKAWDFVVAIASGSADVAPLRTALGMMLNSDELSDDGVTSLPEKMGLVIKAWNLFSAGKPLKSDEITVTSTIDDNGIRRLTEVPTIGGIDRGNPADDTE